MDIVAELRRIVGARFVLTRPSELLAYETDGNTLFRHRPLCVVVPGSGAEAVAVVRLLHRAGVPFVPRGAGTGLSGGAVPEGGEVVVSTARLNRVLSVDPVSLRAVVEPGLINARLSRHVAPLGLHYAPDPSSQFACTIGGNVAENSGGAHCLKYGVTVNHVVALDVVLPDGRLVTLGSPALDRPGYDLLGAFVGSEGTMGLVIRATVRLLRRPQAVRTVLALFESVAGAAATVADVTARGIIPAALEMMDRDAIRAVEAGSFPVGFPPGVSAVLLAEVDGLEEGLDDYAARIVEVCRANGVREVRPARSPEERELWWNNRKTAFGAMGNLAPDYYVQDGVIPRSRLMRVLDDIARVAAHYRFVTANVFHAGDGNLHPLLAYDGRNPGERERVQRAGSEMLAACVEAGGSISGEHGIGIEKREDMRLLFDDGDLLAQRALHDVFDPEERANPGKVLPLPGRCAEVEGARWDPRATVAPEPGPAGQGGPA
jgi:glycolate oxidase